MLASRPVWRLCCRGAGLALLMGLKKAMDVQGQDGDTAHIAKVLKVTLGFASEADADFHTLLYTTQVEFQPLSLGYSAQP